MVRSCLGWGLVDEVGDVDVLEVRWTLMRFGLSRSGSVGSEDDGRRGHALQQPEWKVHVSGTDYSDITVMREL